MKIKIIEVSVDKSGVSQKMLDSRNHSTVSHSIIKEIEGVLGLIEGLKDNSGDISDSSNRFLKFKEIFSSELLQGEIVEAFSCSEDVVKADVMKSIFTDVSDLFFEKMRKTISEENELYMNLHKQVFSMTQKIAEEYDLKTLISIQNIKNQESLNGVFDLHKDIMDHTQDRAFMYKAVLSEEKGREIIQNLMGQYPNVGKGNLSVLRNLRKLDNEYFKYIKEEIHSKTKEFLTMNFPNYDSSGDMINDMILFTTLVFKNGFRESYEKFIERYMNNLFKNISSRKQINRGTKKEETTIPTVTQTTIDGPKKKNCSEEIDVFLNSLFGKIDVSEKQQKEIRSYVLRLHLKGKTIRIKDMIESFPITADLFTEEFVNQAKEIGILFENGNGKKEEESDPQPENKNTNPNVEENESPMQVEDAVKVAFEKKVDWRLKNVKSFDGKGFVGVMKLAGYEVENENHVSKCFNKLYHNAQMKQIFLDELKRNAFTQKKLSLQKKCYRKIEVYSKKGHRILFLQNNKTIDGIYNHDDYENRVAVFLGC